MFSLRLTETRAPDPDRQSWLQRLLGKGLGFMAGLILIAALDALFLHHVVWKAISQTFALRAPTLVQALRAAWTGMGL